MYGYFTLRKAARSWGDFLVRSSGFTNGLSDFAGALALEGTINAGAESGFGCDTLLNLRDFKSEAFVLGNWVVLCFDDEAEGPVVDRGLRVVFGLAIGFSLRDLFFKGAPEAPLIRRFLWGRWVLAFSDIDVEDAEIDVIGGGSFERSLHLSIPNIKREWEGGEIVLTYERRSRSSSCLEQEWLAVAWRVQRPVCHPQQWGVLMDHSA